MQRVGQPSGQQSLAFNALSLADLPLRSSFHWAPTSLDGVVSPSLRLLTGV